MSSYSEDQSEDEQVDWEEVDVDAIGDANLENAESSSRNVVFDIVLSRAGEQPSIKLDLNPSRVSLHSKNKSDKCSIGS